MKKVLYLDCFSGASGDMLLGALFDLGLRPKDITPFIEKVLNEKITIETKETHRGGLSGVSVNIKDSTVPLDIEKTKNMISKSNLSERCKARTIKALDLIINAEKRLHGRHWPLHLHELGTLDTAVDILGFMVCLELLEIEKVFASPVNLGGGSVMTAHGLLPVPAPATTEILQGVPVYGTEGTGELTTPTGAAIIKATVERFGPLPEGVIDRIGYGAGHRENEGRPNIVRAILLNQPSENKETTLVVETNIDDMNPQIYDYLIEALLKEGALDVFLTPVIMKKSRPAVKVSVICREQDLQTVSGVLFRETTTIGLRYYRTSRVVLQRTTTTIETPLGTVRFKKTICDGREQLSPEYDDLKRIASEKGIPLKDVFKEVMKSVL
ncbi:MAG: nickel pincer cofactor biosynthesis protein LarC [Nitrospirae bacterium]|nr:MAG: nickel pincer cofactor biosynthesis protein LarC [Nitrospirota bacterium]